MKTAMTAVLLCAALAMPAAAQTAATPTGNTGTAATTYQMKAGEWRASKVQGVNVYNTNDEKIGDVKELLLSRDGKIEAVVVGVGGFLGMGEHDVALPFDQVQWIDQPRETRTTTSSGSSAAPATGTTPATNARDNASRWYPDHAVVNMTKDQLKSTPEVRWDQR